MSCVTSNFKIYTSQITNLQPLQSQQTLHYCQATVVLIRKDKNVYVKIKENLNKNKSSTGDELWLKYTTEFYHYEEDYFHSLAANWQNQLHIYEEN